MNPGRRDTLILGAAGLAAAAAGFLLGPAVLESTRGSSPGEGAAGAFGALRDASLLDLDGKPRRLTQWLNRILVCNFWATWCAPCREEIPLLMAARTKFSASGLEILGIAIDNVAKVREYSTSLSISYPILVAQADGLELMRKLGNSAGGLPFTVIANGRGEVVRRKLGAFHQGDLDAILGPLTQG